MSKTKIAITLDQHIVKRLDRLVKEDAFTSRSQAIQEAVEEKLQRMDSSRLAKECLKFDPAFEKSIAEEGMSIERIGKKIGRVYLEELDKIIE
ncbi:MAG: ribbon-helix-helix protein, CopG family [Candidatus Kuenenia sp.]|nr:ribbon-helix-helix protein, CopG family [Candidatus Kuenenia hertensis]